MADGGNKTNDETGAQQIEGVTEAQLKKELKGRGLKVTSNKVDLVARLKAALVLEGQHEEESGDDEFSDKRENEHDEAGAYSDEENEARNPSKFVPTFKDVEESIDGFSGDDGKDVKLWIKEFKDMAELCEWDTMQKTIYAKRLLRGSARLVVKSSGSGQTYKIMKEALKEEFALKIDNRIVHKELQQHKKRADESYHKYRYKMGELAARTDIEVRAVIQ